MKKLSVIGAMVCLAVGTYLAWNWVNQIPEPGKFVPQEPADRTEKSDRVALSPRQATRIAVITPPRKAIPDEGPNLGMPARFCVDRINAQGGIRSLPVELVVLESENSALESARAAQQAVESGAVAVIGGYTSSGALASAEVLQKARIPFIAVGATNPDVTRIGEYIFRVNFVDSFQGAAMAEFAYADLGARKAGMVVNVGNRYSPYLAQVFAEQFQQLGGEIRWQRDYLPDPAGYAGLFTDVPRDQADVIVVPGYENDSAGIIRAARAAGIEGTFLGGDGWGPAMFDYAGDQVKDGYYTKGWHPDAGLNQGLQDVLAGWVEKNGPIWRDSTALTLDASYLLFAAMERAEELSPDGIRDALVKTDSFKGIVGSYSFHSSRDPEKPMTVLKLTRPDPVFVKVVHPKRIKLGVIFAKTGDAAQVHQLGFESARFAAEEINRLGGVLGHRIELLEYDSESTVLGSRKAAMQALEDGVAAVVGEARSSNSSAMAPILQSARIPMVTPTSTSPSVTSSGDFIFRACFSDELQGKLLAEFALTDLQANSAAVLTNANSEYSVGLGQFFRDRFNVQGKVVLELDYLQSTTDFKSILERVQDAMPDVVFVPGYSRESVYIIRQARQMGIQAPFVGADGWNDVMYEYTSGELEGSYYSQHWHSEVPDDKSRAFVERYSATHKMVRAGVVALTYDTVCLIADAIRRAGSIKTEDIRIALAKTKGFQGITGKIEFDENRDPLSKPLVILRFGKAASAFHKMVNAQHVPDSSK
jgi:branched-chain amino acid transport system substrate-binding protein